MLYDSVVGWLSIYHNQSRES